MTLLIKTPPESPTDFEIERIKEIAGSETYDSSMVKNLLDVKIGELDEKDAIEERRSELHKEISTEQASFNHALTQMQAVNRKLESQLEQLTRARE